MSKTPHVHETRTIMLNLNRATLAAAALTLAVLSGAATADRGYHHRHDGRVQFGITLGAPLWYPGSYYTPYPSYAYPAYPVYPPAVVVRPTPKVYVERDDQVTLERTAPAPAPFWYFCRDSETYYPYVKECATPWERVPVRPATP